MTTQARKAAGSQASTAWTTILHRPWRLILWYAVALHCLWGVLLLASPSVLGVTAVHSAAASWLPDGATLRGALLLVVGIAAGIGITVGNRRSLVAGLACILPQQMVLMSSAMGAVAAITHATFADGVPHPRAFIAADQAPAILAAILHSIGLIEVYVPHLGSMLRRGFLR